jgi:hypothetical protein
MWAPSSLAPTYRSSNDTIRLRSSREPMRRARAIV